MSTVVILNIVAGITLVVLNTIAFIDIRHRDRARLDDGLNGEMSNIYRMYRWRSVGRSLVGAALLVIAQMPLCQTYGVGLFVVGAVTLALSLLDWHFVRRAERMAADRLRKERLS